MSTFGSGFDLTIKATLRNEVSGPARVIKQELRGIGDEVARVDVKTKAATATADAHGAASRAQAGHVKALHERILGLSRDVGGILVTGLKAATIGVGALGAAATLFGLKAASNFQQTRIAFDTMLGSVEAGGKLFKQLQDLNLKSPFELSQITQATQVLLRYGVAGDQVVAITKGIANAAALSGPRMAENLDRISLALGQVQAKGKLQGEEARQLAEAGINAYGVYERKLGLTRAQVEKLGEAGKLSGQTLLDAVAAGDLGIQGLNESAEKLSMTLGGQFSNLKDLLNVGLADAAQPLVKQLQGLIGSPDAPGALVKGITTLVSTVGPPIFTLVGKIAELVTRALPALAPILDAVVNGAGRLLDAMAPGFAALEPVAGELSDALVDLVTALVPVMPELVTAFVGLARVAPEFVRMLAAMVPLVTPVLTLVNGLLGLEPVRTGLAGVLTVLLGYRALTALKGILADVAGGLRGVAGATDEATAARSRSAGIAGAAGVAGGVMLLDANRRKLSAGSVLEGAAGGALLGGAIGSVVPGIGTAVGAGAGALIGGIGTFAFGAGRRDAGDTPTPKTLAGTVDRHRFAEAMAPGQRTVTNAFIGGTLDSDHRAGRALDLTGSGLFGYAQVVRAAGGYADFHGGHLHAVYGDTPSPRSSSSSTTSRAGTTVLVDIHDNVITAEVDLELAVARGIARHDRDRKERD